MNNFIINIGLKIGCGIKLTKKSFYYLSTSLYNFCGFFHECNIEIPIYIMTKKIKFGNLHVYSDKYEFQKLHLFMSPNYYYLIKTKFLNIDNFKNYIDENKDKIFYFENNEFKKIQIRFSNDNKILFIK